MERVQTVVIGAGVVGLAIARALALSGREVIVLERESMIGSVTSARNSEVIHAGIYYPTGSLKARLCVSGKAALYAYCAARHIPHARPGKLIVATSAEEERRLAGIAAQARANCVDDLEALSGAAARALEPELRCTAALLSPSTGILDSHAFMLSLRGEAEEAGAAIALETPVLRLEVSGDGLAIETGGAAPMRLLAREVVNAAGHGAPGLGGAIAPAPRTWLARGCYFALSGKAPFARLIYPMPDRATLGVHYTRDLNGGGKFGPDIEWIEEMDYTVDPDRAAGFCAAIRRYWPGLPDGALAPDYAGIRPKIAGPGEPPADFRIDGPAEHGVPGYVGLYGIESPGLTSSLAIAGHVVSLLDAVRTPARRIA